MRCKSLLPTYFIIIRLDLVLDENLLKRVHVIFFNYFVPGIIPAV